MPAVAGRTEAAPFVTDQPPQQLMDGDIRQRLAAGQFHEAFERLVEQYSVKIFHLAYSMIGNETQAEDLAQEVLLRIWKGLAGYHGGRFSFHLDLYDRAQYLPHGVETARPAPDDLAG